MEAALATLRVTDLPALVLQPKMELSDLSQRIYARLGVSPADRRTMPTLDGLIPDVLLAVGADPNAYEIMPNAERRKVAADDARIGLCVIDVKHARDPNPSYSAEVVLYAVMLANWLAERGLNDHFLVRTETYLWTRGGMARGHFEASLDLDEPTPEAIIDAIGEDLEPINTAIFLQTIRRFFNRADARRDRQGRRQRPVAPTRMGCHRRLRILRLARLPRLPQRGPAGQGRRGPARLLSPALARGGPPQPHPPIHHRRPPRHGPCQPRHRRAHRRHGRNGTRVRAAQPLQSERAAVPAYAGP